MSSSSLPPLALPSHHPLLSLLTPPLTLTPPRDPQTLVRRARARRRRHPHDPGAPVHLPDGGGVDASPRRAHRRPRRLRPGPRPGPPRGDARALAGPPLLRFPRRRPRVSGPHDPGRPRVPGRRPVLPGARRAAHGARVRLGRVRVGRVRHRPPALVARRHRQLGDAVGRRDGRLRGRRLRGGAEGDDGDAARDADAAVGRREVPSARRRAVQPRVARRDGGVRKRQDDGAERLGARVSTRHVALFARGLGAALGRVGGDGGGERERASSRRRWSLLFRGDDSSPRLGVFGRRLGEARRAARARRAADRGAREPARRRGGGAREEEGSDGVEGSGKAGVRAVHPRGDDDAADAEPLRRQPRERRARPSRRRRVVAHRLVPRRRRRGTRDDDDASLRRVRRRFGRRDALGARVRVRARRRRVFTRSVRAAGPGAHVPGVRAVGEGGPVPVSRFPRLGGAPPSSGRSPSRRRLGLGRVRSRGDGDVAAGRRERPHGRAHRRVRQNQGRGGGSRDGGEQPGARDSPRARARRGRGERVAIFFRRRGDARRGNVSGLGVVRRGDDASGVHRGHLHGPPRAPRRRARGGGGGGAVPRVRGRGRERGRHRPRRHPAVARGAAPA